MQRRFLSEQACGRIPISALPELAFWRISSIFVSFEEIILSGNLRDSSGNNDHRGTGAQEWMVIVCWLRSNVCTVWTAFSDSESRDLACSTATLPVAVNSIRFLPRWKSGTPKQENFNVFDFVLTDEEMKQMEVLDTGKSLFFSHYSPETVERFMSIV